ncbi:hypothetical protein [Janthinobacterium sp. CG3]|uniref:hypothetical protein n=1 Tax=Janthinobacterium sp. CG3 TaxID=1075768 RepID=UPI0012F8E5D0|nr:hypothetical protein [Janthinobacterium sp. CG3]
MTRLAMLGIWVGCLISGAVASVWMLAAIVAGSRRGWRLAKAFDRLANAATGGADTETISSRANRARSEGRRWGCVLCRLLDRIDKNHCRKSSGI